MRNRRTNPFKNVIGGAWNPTVYGCHHWRQPVRVGRFTVTCSAGYGGHLEKDVVKPDFGIYLTETGFWKEQLGAIWTNGSCIRSVARQRPYAALIIDWKDMSAIEPARLSQLVNIALSKMRHGKAIDIGCNAAHGRTGTLLASLIARVEHLSAADAIAAVHKRYCNMAVESHTQRQAVEAYVKQMGIRVKEEKHGSKKEGTGIYNPRFTR